MALVLSGGGTRGDFELGACRWLYDNVLPRRGADVRPDIFCGTSVGSINLGVLAEGGLDALAELERIWFTRMRADTDFMIESPEMRAVRTALDRLVADAPRWLGLLLVPWPEWWAHPLVMGLAGSQLPAEVRNVYNAVCELRGVYTPEPILQMARERVNTWSPPGPGHTGPGFAVIPTSDGHHAIIARGPDDVLRVRARDATGAERSIVLASNAATSPSALHGSSRITVTWAGPDGIHWIDRQVTDTDLTARWSAIHTIAYPAGTTLAGAPIVFDERDRTIAVVLRAADRRRRLFVSRLTPGALTPIDDSIDAGGLPHGFVDHTGRRWLALRVADGELRLFAGAAGQGFTHQRARPPLRCASDPRQYELAGVRYLIVRAPFQYNWRERGFQRADDESQQPGGNLVRYTLDGADATADDDDDDDEHPPATSNPAVVVTRGEPHIVFRDPQLRVAVWRPGHPPLAWALPPDTGRAPARARHAAGDPIALIERDGGVRIWVAAGDGTLWTRSLVADWERIDAPVWTGPQVRFVVASLEDNKVASVDGAGRLDRPGAGLVPPLAGAMASCVVPAVFPPVRFAGGHWLDGGMRSVTPIRSALDAGAARVYAVVASSSDPGPTPRLLRPLDQLFSRDPTDDRPQPMVASWSDASLVEIGLRATFALMPQAVAEAELHPSSQPWPDSVTLIQPSFELHQPNVVDPGLIRIAYAYGWMRAADVVAHRGDPRAIASTDEIIRMRAELHELEERYYRRYHRQFSNDYDPDRRRDTDPPGRAADVRRDCAGATTARDGVARLERQQNPFGGLNPELAAVMARLRSVLADIHAARNDLVDIRARKRRLREALVRRKAAGFPLPPGSSTVASDFEAHRWAAARVPPLWNEFGGGTPAIFPDLYPGSLRAEAPPPPPP